MSAATRIPASLAIAGLAVVVSVGTHAGLLSVRGMPEAVEVEGGGGAQVAMQGTAFADMARAVAPVAPAERVMPVVTPDVASAVRLVQDAVSAPDAAQEAPAPSGLAALPAAGATAAPRMAGAPAVAVATDSARRPDPQVAAPVTTDATPRPVTSPLVTPPVHSVTATVAEPVKPAPALAAPEEAVTASSAEAVETLQTAAIAANEATTAPRLSARPRSRPAAVEDRAADAVARAEPDTPSVPQATPARPDNAQADARRGSAGGSQTGQAPSSGQGRQAATGNAAASNYPGEVQRRIARQRLPRVRASGVAQVSFTVAGNGGLSALGLAQSSGSAELDREAVDLVLRAAPFPPPPPGARTSFTIPVRAR